MGHNTIYHGTYPSQWSEWAWNFEHSRYVRYRLVNKGTKISLPHRHNREIDPVSDEYEWDDYQEPISTVEYPSEQYSEHASEYTSESTSDLHQNTTSQSDRDSGYHSESESEGFEDLIDHPDSWTVNPFLAFGFPPAKDSAKKHQRKRQSKSQSGLEISRVRLKPSTHPI